tara:strand:+ start:33492 stop:34463 length:972 start_codon:yes stop_codon:yes gene_type:complete
VNHYLVTGTAGFIGAATAKRLLELGHRVTGIDNLNDFYDVSLKEHRLQALREHQEFSYQTMDIEDFKGLQRLFENQSFDAVLNLAARANPVKSINDPNVYFSTNVQGTINLLRLMGRFDVRRFILASSSSVYAGHDPPFDEDMRVDHPISPYAASKRGAELIAYTYHYLHQINVAVLRYFTVFGPAGRPDMAPFRFVRWIAEGDAIEVFGDGSQSRDFTYIEDIVEGTIRSLEISGYEVLNLGGGRNPITINQLISIIEKQLAKCAIIHRTRRAEGDMNVTRADITKSKKLLDWEPTISVQEGIGKTIKWYKENRLLARRIRL